MKRATTRSTRLTLTLILVAASVAFVAEAVEPGRDSANALAAPALDKSVPANLDLPKDFKPPKDGKREGLGFRRTSGVALEEMQGTYPICVVEVRKGFIANDPLEAGDLIIAVNGKPLGKNPTAQFRKSLDDGRKSSGVMWLSRWRKGTITRCMVNLGTHILDLTKGGIPDSTRDWALGPIGVNGWGYSRGAKQGGSSLARQLLVTLVDKDGPAAGKLEVGDVILGTDGRKFNTDVRKALAAAIDEAEKERNGGRLKLRVWRPSAGLGAGPGKELDVTLTLQVLGTYSKTAPFDCPKTDKIIENGVEYMKKNSETLLKPGGWISYINGLGLLATGREDVMPMVKALAHGSLLKPGETLSVEKHVSMQCWWWSYRTVFLSEYYLRTRDNAVLPTIDEYATKIAMGQSGAGTWGHTYAARENTGYLHGHLGGYGAINQQGLTLMIALPLAAKCGIRNKEVLDAIKRGYDFFKFFIDKGTIPYGDHGAANEWFDDNGKSGSAAIFFDLMGNREGAQFFCDMILGSAPSGREMGHTGHFWSHMWGGPGAARGGDVGLQTFMKVMNPIFTLERQHNGRFAFQDNVGERGDKGKPKAKWDCTGARMLQLCVPRRALYITGKKTPRTTHLTQGRIRQILRAGRLQIDKEARAELTVPSILELLKDPLPPVRSIGARTLAEREINCVDQLMEMLDSKNKYARYGAAEGLCKAGSGSKKAADKLISLMATDTDVTFQTYAIAALINRDEKFGLLTVARPAIPVLMSMAVNHSDDDPRRVLQHDIGRALFYNGRAQPRRGLLPKYGLEGVDRSLLIPAIKEILTNENGWARSTLTGFIYPLLTKEELGQLWRDIYRATRHIAPSGIMFASGARTHGLKLMGEHHIKEGMFLAAWYIRWQKGHGGPGRVPPALEALENYGAHAKAMIPYLEEYALKYWIARRNPRRKPGPDDTANRIIAAIERIKASTEKPELVSIAKYLKKSDYPPKDGP